MGSLVVNAISWTLEQTFLGRLVIIRRDLQRTVRADFLGFARQVNRLTRRIPAGAGEHFDLACTKLYRERDDFEMLLVIHRRRFTGGAHGHDAIHPRLDLHPNQAFQGRCVELAVFERRYNGGVSSCEHDFIRRIN